MTIVSKGISAFGRLAAAAALLAAFLFGMVGVVYMSLSGSEIAVPEIVGKDFAESEKELAALGLKIKRRADRPSSEKINTVLEQLPKAGETVKTGQMILVVVSKAGGPAEEQPSSLKKEIESDDAEKIGEMITDKPKKSKANSNANKKKPDTTRDAAGNKADANVTVDAGSAVPETGHANASAGEKTDKKTVPAAAPKPAKAVPEKTPSLRPSSGDTRPRTATKP